MAGFREAFIKGTQVLASGLPTAQLLRWSGQQLVLPFYHAISDQKLPHIEHLYAVKNTKQFVKDLDQLLKVFTPIDLHEFQKLTIEKRQPNKPSFLLSFDDGLREFHDVIAPVLLAKGVPAVCFLNSAFVDNQDLFFRYKESLLIDRLQANRSLEQAPEIVAWAAAREARGSIAQKVLSIKYDQRNTLDELAKLMDFSFNDFLKKQQPYLSTAKVDRLIKQGFHFGAHSVDHPEYRLLPQAEQLRQTTTSIAWVCDRFNLPYKVFSFPFTDYQVRQSFFNQLAAEEIVDLTFGGAGQKQEQIPFHFQRMPLELENLSARQIINSELLYYLLKQPLGKNLIRRT